jgi:hypothetical protein
VRLWIGAIGGLSSAPVTISLRLWEANALTTSVRRMSCGVFFVMARSQKACCLATAAALPPDLPSANCGIGHTLAMSSGVMSACWFRDAALVNSEPTLIDLTPGTVGCDCGLLGGALSTGFPMISGRIGLADADGLLNGMIMLTVARARSVGVNWLFASRSMILLDASLHALLGQSALRISAVQPYTSAAESTWA